jgi:4-hydroxy-4-methyl-2-oxoglutarate aldolase
LIESVRWAELGVATIYEAAGQRGLIDLALNQIVPGTKAAGPARTVMCGQGDNLMVHAAIAEARPGDVLVIDMPSVAAVALVGELLATQAAARGVAALIVNAAIRDVEALRALGLPVWARWVRAAAATKQLRGSIDKPMRIGGADLRAGDIVVADADGVVVVPAERQDDILRASEDRERREREAREKYRRGALSYDLLGLRPKDERS